MALGAYTRTHTFVEESDYEKPGAHRPAHPWFNDQQFDVIIPGMCL